MQGLRGGLATLPPAASRARTVGHWRLPGSGEGSEGPNGNAMMAELYDRMPVILEPAWLGEVEVDPATLLRPLAMMC
jgi:hypothetical protein